MWLPMNERKLRELELDAKTAGDNVDKLQRIARVDVPVLIAEIRRLKMEGDVAPWFLVD
jgi:hypothetical protein